MCRFLTSGLTLALLSLPRAGSASTLSANQRTHAPVTVVTYRAHRPTPEEVGRAAGLRIRHELQRQRELTHRGTLTARRTMAPAATPAVWRNQPIARQAATTNQLDPALAARREAAIRRYEEAVNRDALPSRAAAHASAAPVAFSARNHLVKSSQALADTDEPKPAEFQDADSQATIQPAAHLVEAHYLMPVPALKGSLASLERQNEILEAEGLERIQNEADLSSRIAHKFLVPVPVSDALTINPDLPAHHRYCRPWTARFLTDLARMHDQAFHKPLEVSSAVRTVVYQARLRQINGNAAPAEGDVVSPHLTGATIDIAKDGLTRQEIEWMRRWLLPLEMAGKIDVEEEFQQACFHITVYKTYVTTRPTPPARSRRVVTHTAEKASATPVAG